MHRQLRAFAIPVFLLGVAVHVLSADKAPVTLPEFRIEGTPWLYAKAGDMEILSRASPWRARQYASALVRGRRLHPDFLTQGRPLPLQLIVVESSRQTISDLGPGVTVGSDERLWPAGYREKRDCSHSLADEKICVDAVNLAGVDNIWMIISSWAKRRVLAQQPAFPSWVTEGVFGEAGPLRAVIGVPRSTTVQLPRLSWPDGAVPPGEFPREAGEFPDFAVMFDPRRKADGMTPAEKNRFQFQTALFARWSLFGPAKKGRNRNGYWAFAEMARRGQATEEVFRECYGMDWPQACAEMRAYLKPRNVGLLELHMPHVMSDVPELERMEFRDATLEEVRRILGNFHRLLAAQTERERAAQSSEDATAAR